MGSLTTANPVILICTRDVSGHCRSNSQPLRLDFFNPVSFAKLGASRHLWQNYNFALKPISTTRPNGFATQLS